MNTVDITHLHTQFQREAAEAVASRNCVSCSKPFTFSGPGQNVFTEAGRREVSISGLCETCFDDACPDE